MKLQHQRLWNCASLAMLLDHWTAISLTVQGFQISSSAPSMISRFSGCQTPRSLFLETGGSAEFSSETIESSASNTWGIPDSTTLDPLSKTPVDRLENGAKITLVGSGPGDPDLLTVKALKLLQDPNALVICDRLVSQEIVDLVKGEIKTARKLPGCADLAQEEIYWWTYQGLKAGKHVIRLKIGDPFVFGRGGEEILTFRRFGVESTVVPVRCTRCRRRCER
jgi:Tetrapyrrole (Corrin/Porphyrin) Methylases